MAPGVSLHARAACGVGGTQFEERFPTSNPAGVGASLRAVAAKTGALPTAAVDAVELAVRSRRFHGIPGAVARGSTILPPFPAEDACIRARTAALRTPPRPTE